MNTESEENTTHYPSKNKLIEQFKENWNVELWTQGFFNEEYISSINVHWLKFNPPSASSFITLGILYILIMLIGVAGNGLVIFMFCRCKTLRTPQNTLIVNLAVSDVLMLLKMPVFIYNCFHKGPVLGDLACRIYGFVGGISGTASIGTLTAISFDRYFVIKYPLKRFSNTRIYTCLICSWIYAFSFSLVPLLNIGFGKYQYEGYLTSCSFDYLTEDRATKTYILIFFLAAFVVPMCIIGFSYFKIVQVVGARSLTEFGKRDSFRHIKEEDKRKQEIKLATIVLIVIFLWFFSWSPYATVALLGISGQKHLISPLASMIPALFCKTTSAIDPYIYAISHPKFREELRKLLGITEKKTFKNSRKVWSTKVQFSRSSKFGSKGCIDDDSVEEETVEIDLRSPSLDEYTMSTQDTVEEEIKTKEQELRRQASRVSLLCLNPSFSNKTSSFRRLSRKCSSLSRSQSIEKKATTY